jgi:hypothetical protein
MSRYIVKLYLEKSKRLIIWDGFIACSLEINSQINQPANNVFLSQRISQHYFQPTWSAQANRLLVVIKRNPRATYSTIWMLVLWAEPDFSQAASAHLDQVLAHIFFSPVYLSDSKNSGIQDIHRETRQHSKVYDEKKCSALRSTNDPKSHLPTPGSSLTDY